MQRSGIAQQVPVTADNFVRAESDLYFANLVKRNGGVGKVHHERQPATIDDQTVIRENRDTLYSSGVFDLEAGALTVILPPSSGRFRSLMILDEDEYVHAVEYDAGTFVFDRKNIGTRYIVAAIRTFTDPNDAADLKAAHALQDATVVKQEHSGSFEIPSWEPNSQKTVRQALLALAATLPDLRGMFGSRDEVDPVRHFIGAASAWGGNPVRDAVYLNVTPAQNDGRTIYTLTVKDVPVDGFWSVSVYNEKGYFEKNARNSYTLNGVTASKRPDGSITIQFGSFPEAKPLG